MPRQKSKTFFYSFGNMDIQSQSQKNQSEESKRVIINIDDDEVEEIDFKEI